MPDDLLARVKAALDDELPWNWGSDDRDDVRDLVARCEQAEHDLAVLCHQEALLEARTQRGVTDCSTPLPQRVDNIVRQLEKAEREHDAARAAQAVAEASYQEAQLTIAGLEAEREHYRTGMAAARAEVERVRALVEAAFSDTQMEGER